MEFDAAGIGIASLALFGFTGSLHCAAMCGVLAGSACGVPRTDALGATQYLLARGLSYALLGAVAGLLSALTVRSWIGEAGRALGLAFGALTILYALADVWSTGRRRQGKTTPTRWTVALGRIQEGLRGMPFPRPVILGVTTAFLPCGFLAAALLQAALLAHPAYSALAMLAFALASSPSLFAGSRILTILGGRWPRATPYLAAAVMGLAGVSMIVRAWHVHEHHDHARHLEAN